MKRQILGNQVEKFTLQKNMKASNCNVERKREVIQPKVGGGPQALLGFGREEGGGRHEGGCWSPWTIWPHP